MRKSCDSEIGVASKTYQDGQVVVVELGLNLQQQNQNRPFCSSLRGSSDGSDDHDNDDNGRVGGPTSCNVYNNNNSTSRNMSDVYDSVVVGDHFSTSTTTGAGLVRSLQPFDVSYTSPANSFFKPSGGMATSSMGFPFTAAQWKELERQAMIYKYMVASLPVPPDLLYSTFPTNLTHPSTFPQSSYLLGKYGNGYNLRWVGNNKDAEPGRCRRTDGKKWRCSRDVAPNQKYCERHMHRGRPRSRKHVELVHRPHSITDFSTSDKIKDTPTTKKTRLNESNPQPVGSAFPPILPSKASAFDHHSLVSGANPFEDSRSLAWTEEQQWQHLMQTNMNSQVFHHHFEGEPLNLNSHGGFSAKSDMGLSERPLIDAWSMGSKDNCGGNKSSFSSNHGHGNAIDDDMCQIQMGLGVIDSWVESPTSPGGPLAEVLRPGSIAAISNAGEGDFVTPPATAVSSPSGVLQKTLASFSDSSGSSSPTCQNSKANSDMPFHWLN